MLELKIQNKDVQFQYLDVVLSECTACCEILDSHSDSQNNSFLGCSAVSLVEVYRRFRSRPDDGGSTYL
jgi:hypothetical protein